MQPGSSPGTFRKLRRLWRCSRSRSIEVSARLLREEERAQFDELLEQKHYLCSAQMVGRTLRYVAELDGEWIALACFSAAALHLKAREK